MVLIAQAFGEKVGDEVSRKLFRRDRSIEIRRDFDRRKTLDKKIVGENALNQQKTKMIERTGIDATGKIDGGRNERIQWLKFERDERSDCSVDDLLLRCNWSCRKVRSSVIYRQWLMTTCWATANR